MTKLMTARFAKASCAAALAASLLAGCASVREPYSTRPVRHAYRLLEREVERVIRHRQRLAVDLGGEPAEVLEAGGHIGHVELAFQEPLATLPESRVRPSREALAAAMEELR